MEGVLGRDEHRPAGTLLAPDQLDRCLVGLGTRVREEHPALDAEQPDQPLGELDLRLVQVQVRGVRQPPGLVGHGLHDRRMRVPERADRDAGDQVQVGVPVDVPDHAAVAARQRDRRHAEGHHDRGGVPALQFLCCGH